MRSPRFVTVWSLFALLLVLPAGAKKKPVAEAAEAADSRLSSETLSGLELRSIGPALMSGRIADIAIHPRHQSTWLVAVGSGGVWKTTNAGTTWQPIFDREGSYSIGCLTIDPGHPEVVWVGTGENVGGRHVGFGDGVYKSLDGGASWQNMGLGSSEHIGKILVDPGDSQVVHVAAQGPLWSGGGDRGLYKTTDGGATWQQILAAGQWTGVNDVIFDPRDADVLYASSHQRQRSVGVLVNGGPESAIHKSTDGGASWRQLESGLPPEDKGRIGLAISPQNPDVVYATIELAHREGGFWRSADAGGTWEKRSDYLSGGTGPHYYQEIFASPHQLDRIYQMDVWMHVSDDGGKTFVRMSEEHKHSDNHALAFDANDPNYLLSGSDGGLYETWDQGAHWRFVDNLPVTQFYKLALDSKTPFYTIYGGTQDNNTQGGPSRTTNAHGIRNSDWFVALFGDGHQPAVDPSNADIVYAQWQQGNLVRHDRKTGETVYIQPQPEQGGPAERWNWDSPVLISPHNPARLYFASQRLWRSDDRGDSWKPISADLSRAEDRLLQPIMGRVWSYDSLWDLWAMSNYGNITSVAESPRFEGLLYAGSDDGLIQVSADGGTGWRQAAVLPGVPERAFVNDLKADLFDADTVYVALDNHKQGDFAPYLLRSTDRGRSWQSIVGDLPERHLVWRLVQDHVDPELLFAATEDGIFVTVDAGAHWLKLTGGVPQISFRDLAIQRRESDLVGASFGRGFYVFDDYSPLRGLSEELLASEAELFAVRPWWYVERQPLGGGEKAAQGSAFFTAPNPPFGAVFTYYLRDGFDSRADRRRQAEGEIAKEGGNTPYPGWDELRREAREEEPQIVLTVRDSNGQTVRRLEGPVGKGFHRVAWDLRYPSLAAWSADGPDDGPGGGGFLVAPGTYSVSLAQRVEGQLSELGERRSLTLKPLGEPSLPGSDKATAAAFRVQLGELQRIFTGTTAAIDETTERLKALQQTMARAALDDGELEGAARALGARLDDLREQLSGNRQKSNLGEPQPVTVGGRLFAASYRGRRDAERRARAEAKGPR